MAIDLVSGTYVVAVSGGVDSMVLLDMLRQNPGLKLIVAHYDHGIRDDSADDRRLVGQVARQYGLPFVYDHGNLGPYASEAQARQARYDFLHHVRSASSARGIITAHHQDDALETAVLQLLRGTGRRGLSSLDSRLTLERPLLDFTKADLQRYGKDQGLTWREDRTNQDLKYLRNYIRHQLLPRLSAAQQQQLQQLVARMREVNTELDQLLDICLHLQPSVTSLERAWFINLPHSLSAEVLAHWLRGRSIRGFTRKQLDKLVVRAKTLRPGQQVDINKTAVLKIEPNILALVPRDR
ncbi:tRNA lysidine(34) synthetase TilS [Candidatus Saccharibacteria bacterium]|nr:tRNA lysidine(34) synthetase TilS [Candidatus Saccharibacteria bacterium]